MTEVEPVLHKQATAQATNSPCDNQLNTTRVDLEYVVEQVVLIKGSSGSFIFPLSRLFHNCSTSIYSFIYH